MEVLDKLNYEALTEQIWLDPLQGIYSFYQPGLGFLHAIITCIGDQNSLRWIVEEASIRMSVSAKQLWLNKEAREQIADKINELYW